ncbi:MAG: hypothetical protein V4558_16010 [Gemmatimonadota bacterium]
MRALLLVAVVGLAAVSLMAARQPLPHDGFQVSVERTSSGWRARCGAGCSWKELSSVCPGDCRTLIDANGVVSNVKEEKTDAAFGFVITRTRKGWQAESIAGTSWKQVGWSCSVASCRASLDAAGVTVVPLFRLF